MLRTYVYTETWRPVCPSARPYACPCPLSRACGDCRACVANVWEYVIWMNHISRATVAFLRLQPLAPPQPSIQRRSIQLSLSFRSFCLPPRTDLGKCYHYNLVLHLAIFVYASKVTSSIGWVGNKGSRMQRLVVELSRNVSILYRYSTASGLRIFFCRGL